MMTRFQSRANLYQDVLEQPLLLDQITQFLNPNDLVHLKMAGYRDPRFHYTLDHVLKDRREKHLETKHSEFIKTIKQFLIVHENLERDSQFRNLNDMYDFLVENIWFRQDPYFRTLDLMVERKLIELSIHSEYYNGFAYLYDLYGIVVQAEYSEDLGDLVEYIIDTKGTKHYI